MPSKCGRARCQHGGECSDGAREPFLASLSEGSNSSAELKNQKNRIVTRLHRILRLGMERGFLQPTPAVAAATSAVNDC